MPAWCSVQANGVFTGAVNSLLNSVAPTRLPYYLGLPAWAFAGWKDRYFVNTPTRLESYSTVFNAVEGNTTFYSIPSPSAVARWRDSVPHDFRFCFKLPQRVTHAERPDQQELRRFLDAIRPMSGHLGPLMVQLPASVDPAGIERLEPVLERVAEDHSFVIEVRHRSFFREPGLLKPWLDRYRAGRVILDSRPIYQGDRSHPEVLEALHEKPDLPVLRTVSGDRPFVRLILHPDISSNEPWLDAWADQAAKWITAGMAPYMMIHCPNNLHCPPLALDFHERLRSHLELPALAAWPVPEQRALL